MFKFIGKFNAILKIAAISSEDKIQNMIFYLHSLINIKNPEKKIYVSFSEK